MATTTQNRSFNRSAAGSRPGYAAGNRAAASSSNRASTSVDGEKKESKTTHYMKPVGAKGQFVAGTFITENEHGLFVAVKETIQPGEYYINKKRALVATDSDSVEL